jgi:hypothetical protein
MLRSGFILAVTGFWLTSCVYWPQPVKSPQPAVKRTVYHEVALEEMIRRNIAKTQDPANPSIEGIYTVSVVITKKGRSLIFPSDKERVVLRKDNYAKVAILKDWPESKNEFVEISISSKNLYKYPIVGEINRLAEGGGFIYKHIEPKGEEFSFTFLYDESKPDILEGIYSNAKNGVEFTYKLTYLRVFPKSTSRITDLN